MKVRGVMYRREEPMGRSLAHQVAKMQLCCVHSTLIAVIELRSVRELHASKRGTRASPGKSGGGVDESAQGWGPSLPKRN